MAILNNNIEIAKSLLRSGAKVDDSPYPLHCAIQQDNLEMVKLLLLFGADPNLQTRSGQSAYDIITPTQKRIKEALTTIKKEKKNIAKQKIEMFQPPVTTLSDLLDRLPPPKRRPDLSAFSNL